MPAPYTDIAYKQHKIPPSDAAQPLSNKLPDKMKAVKSCDFTAFGGFEGRKTCKIRQELSRAECVKGAFPHHDQHAEVCR